MSTPSHRLLVFLKAPRPGTVKTRLAQTLGAAAAAAAYRQLVDIVLGQLSSLPSVELRFAPDEARAEILPWLRPGWSAVAQGRGDLGERLTRAFAEAFSTGASRVVIIGSDCPEVTSDDVQAAWTALAQHDLVLGPAEDGGYWLIGLRASEPRLFAGVHWSTGTVRQETLERAQVAGLSHTLLRPLHDVDTEADWQRFLAVRAR